MTRMRRTHLSDDSFDPPRSWRFGVDAATPLPLAISRSAEARIADAALPAIRLGA